jgi:hypothetical protein
MFKRIHIAHYRLPGHKWTIPNSHISILSHSHTRMEEAKEAKQKKGNETENKQAFGCFCERNGHYILV